MASETRNVNPYLRTKVLTANPEALRLLLIEGAIKFARQGRDGLASKDHEASYEGLTKCRDILMELINSMRPEVDPELCRRVSSLYTFLYAHLLEASLEHDVAKVDRVLELLEYERQTWSLLMDKLAEERAAATAVRAAASESVAQEAADPAARYTPLSLEG